MSIEIIPSEQRGVTRLDWLESKHSFSFGDYYDPKRMGFGALRVLNEDTIHPGGGFGMHPHANMEIVTLVFQGRLEHKDSMENHGLIESGDVQRMSAGSGIVHSEYNRSRMERVHLLQIWIEAKEKDIEPSYEQKKGLLKFKKNQIVPIVSGSREKDAVYIHQNSIFSFALLDRGVSVSYEAFKKENGTFIFVVDGEINFNGSGLKNGDAATVLGRETIKLTSEKFSSCLLIEVPI